MLTENEAEYVNAREAARLLGVSQRAVRNLAGQQRLEVVKTEGGGRRHALHGLLGLRAEATPEAATVSDWGQGQRS